MKHRYLILAISALAGLSPVLSLAQSYSAKPIRMVVPFPAGGATDILARVLPQKLGEKSVKPLWFKTAPAQAAQRRHLLPW